MRGFALIPQVVDIVKLPVIAAGGIADGRGLAAAFALGAEGVHTLRPLTMIFPALIERISDHDRKQRASRRSIWSSQ